MHTANLIAPTAALLTDIGRNDPAQKAGDTADRQVVENFQSPFESAAQQRKDDERNDDIKESDDYALEPTVDRLL